MKRSIVSCARLSLLLSIVTTVPLVAAARVAGPERPVSAPVLERSDRAIVFSSGRTAAMASNGRMALAVWQERRSANQNDLFAARIDANGAVLDPAGIPLTVSNEFEEAPRVAWNGSAFVVAWTSVPFPGSHSVSMLEIGEDSRVVGPPQTIAEGDLDDLAFGHGVTAAVTHMPGTFDAPLTLVLVQPGGAVVQTSIGSGAGARLTATPDGFAAAWVTFKSSTEVELHGARVSAAGAIQVADTVMATLGSFGYSVAGSGDDVVVAIGGNDLRLIRWKKSGEIENVLTIANHPAIVMSLIVTPSMIAIAAHDSNGAYIVEVTSGGFVADTVRLQTPGSGADVTIIAALGSGFYAVSASLANTANVLGMLAGSAGPPAVLSRRAETQLTPAIASDGTNLLIVWAELHAMSSFSVKGVIATPAGQPLAQPFEIFSDAYNGGAFAVAFDGRNYVVVRQEMSRATEELYQDLVATHVTRDGVPLKDRVPITSQANYQPSPQLVPSPHGLLVAWLDGYWARPEALYAFLSDNGASGFVNLGPADAFAVTWTGSDFVAVLRAAELQVLRLTDRSVERIGQGGAANVASSGDDALLVYRARDGLMAVPLDRDGRPRGDAKVVTSIDAFAALVGAVRVVWDGANYLVAWEQQPVMGGYRQSFTTARGVIVDRLGNAIAPAFELAPGAPHSTAPYPLGLGAGRSIWAYSRLALEESGAERVFTRTLTIAARRRAVKH